jgi:hypothetical protein
MKRVGTLAYILFGVVASLGLAQALSVDWKYYGGVLIDGDGDSLCFYDAKGVVHGIPDGHIRVWTKCLLRKDMDRIDIKQDFNGKILQNTAQKVARYYAPPFAMVASIDENQAMAITQYEETANISYIKSQAQIYYELNCSERMMRELSIYIQANGKSGSRDKPTDWKYVAPEGNAANLLKILCLQQ